MLDGEVPHKIKWLQHWSSDCLWRQAHPDAAAELFDATVATSGDTTQNIATSGGSVRIGASQLPVPTANPATSASQGADLNQRRRPPTKPRKPHSLTASPEGEAQPGGFLFLCVNQDPLVKHLGQIKLVDNLSDIQHLTDQKVCENLRREYRRLRGWRYWISLQVIYYFRFVKVSNLNPANTSSCTPDQRLQTLPIPHSALQIIN